MSSFPNSRNLTSNNGKKIFEFTAELRDINDGWFVGAPPDMQAQIRDTLCELMVDTNCSPAMQLKATIALAQILKGRVASVKLQALLTATSQDLTDSVRHRKGGTE